MADRCVLCGSQDHEVISTRLRHGKTGTVVQCTQCGLSRILGAQDYADKLDNYYAQQYADEYHQGVKKELDSLFESFMPVQAHRGEKIAPYLKSTDRILEIGSSTGSFLHSVQPLVAVIQGLELNKNAAHYATTVRDAATFDQPHESRVLPLNH